MVRDSLLNGWLMNESGGCTWYGRWWWWVVLWIEAGARMIFLFDPLEFVYEWMNEWKHNCCFFSSTEWTLRTLFYSWLKVSRAQSFFICVSDWEFHAIETSSVRPQLKIIYITIRLQCISQIFLSFATSRADCFVHRQCNFSVKPTYIYVEWWKWIRLDWIYVFSMEFH